jgi:hypothetical protein
MRATSLVLTALLAAGALGAQARPDTGARRDSATAADSMHNTSLVREVFAYEGGGRDPFISLLKSGDVRPLINDLKLVSIYYDGVYPARSVAVLRDITNSKIYRLKSGTIVGRLKVNSIRPREVVFTVQEFGYERQETLTLARQGEKP